LCAPDTACGRAARATLANARVPATPDSVQPDHKTILRMIENGSVDASLLYRSETVRPRQQGRVQIVNLPSTVGTEVGYQFAVVRPGPAVDEFLALAGDTERNWKIMALAGLGPLAEDPQ
jgi:hypothetical protein